jgi:hypothetical protein
VLEHYIENFDPEEYVKRFQKDQGGITKKLAIEILRRKIPAESYYQRNIKIYLEQKYREEIYVRKVTQGPYSEGGIADLMVVIRGKYIGLEVKRPVVGNPSKLQLENKRLVESAGGAYAIVRWPEEADAVIRQVIGGTPA